MFSKKQYVLAYYFAQYHSIPENDIVFGSGFHDWKLFDKTNPVLAASPFPLDYPEGMGYYDPTELSVRTRQSSLARKYGVDGFIYYHYWLENKPVMDKVLLNLLEDNEPNLPFCLCFTNESWKHCYGPKFNGGYKSFHSDGSTFRQLYDAPEEHAKYLQKIFQHPNYLKINDLPVFFVYILTSEVSSYLKKLIFCLKSYGIENIYLIANSCNNCLININEETILERIPDALSVFPPHLYYIKLPQFLSCLPEMPGCLIGWNIRPRYPVSDSIFIKKTPKQIQENITKDLIKLADKDCPQLYALFAWNEWAEGATIEPNTITGEGVGFAIKAAREDVAIVEKLISDNKLKFEYGLGENMINCTTTAVYKCRKTIKSGETVISIPGNDNERDKLFSDPCPDIHKLIRVTMNGRVTEYDDKTPIEIPLLTKF